MQYEWKTIRLQKSCGWCYEKRESFKLYAYYALIKHFIPHLSCRKNSKDDIRIIIDTAIESI